MLLSLPLSWGWQQILLNEVPLSCAMIINLSSWNWLMCIFCMWGLGSQSVPCEKHKYDPKSLKMDTALVMLFSDVKKPVNVFGVSSNCHKVLWIYYVNGVNQSAKLIALRTTFLFLPHFDIICLFVLYNKETLQLLLQLFFLWTYFIIIAMVAFAHFGEHKKPFDVISCLYKSIQGVVIGPEKLCHYQSWRKRFLVE